MRLKALLFALFLMLPSSGWATPKTTVKHVTYLGGELHEACTSGVCDGLVIWKNGTRQDVHNRKRGKWYPVTFADEGIPLSSGGDAPMGHHRLPVSWLLQPIEPTLPPAYMSNMMTGMLVRTGTAIIDDYILISPTQVTAWGGMITATNKAHLAVDMMNDALLHSGVDAQVHVVGVAQDTVDEVSDFSTNLQELHDRVVAGGFDTVRTQTGFDIITKLIRNGSYCGWGYKYSGYWQYAQSVVNGDCSASNLSLAHEVGHLLGLDHNIGDTGGASLTGCGATAVGYGTSAFRTVMSYPDVVIDGVTYHYGPRTAQYSAPPPAVWFSNGTSAVGTAQTDATGCLKVTVATIAAFHAPAEGVPPPPPPINHTAPTNVAWLRTGAPGATVAGNLTWSHTRTPDLNNYKYSVDGAGAVNLNLPGTNTAVVTLSSGTRSLVLSACYTDAVCLSATALTIVVPAAITTMVVSGLSPADGTHFAKGSTVTFSVTATDDSGIASVVGYYSNKNAYQTKSTTRSGNTWTFQVRRPTGTRRWYFVITAVDAEVVQTATRTIIVP